MSIRAGVITALLLALAPAALAADDYEIRLQRPSKAGTSFTVSATSTLRSSETVDLPNGISNKTSLFRRIIMDADVHIDKIDDQPPPATLPATPAAASIIIHQLTLQASGADPSTALAAPKVVLDPGTAVTLTYAAGQPMFALKVPGTLSDDALLALQQAFSRLTVTDAVYGTTDRKKIGDAWPLNKAALAGDKTNPQYVDPASITGSVTLKSLRTLGGIACLQIDGTMTARDFPMQGAAPKEGTMTAVFSALLPTDLARPAVAWSMRSTVHFVTEEKPLGQGTVRKTVDSETLQESAWLPKS